MNKQIIHYGTAAVSVLTVLAGTVTSVAGLFPSTYKGVAVESAGLIGAAIVGIKAFDNAIQQQNVDNSARYTDSELGNNTPYKPEPVAVPVEDKPESAQTPDQG